MLAASGQVCGSGEIGRHTILRGWRRKAWGFKSPLPHHASLQVVSNVKSLPYWLILALFRVNVRSAGRED